MAATASICAQSDSASSGQPVPCTTRQATAAVLGHGGCAIQRTAHRLAIQATSASCLQISPFVALPFQFVLQLPYCSIVLLLRRILLDAEAVGKLVPPHLVKLLSIENLAFILIENLIHKLEECMPNLGRRRLLFGAR
jgi:hypothetical protein